MTGAGVSVIRVVAGSRARVTFVDAAGSTYAGADIVIRREVHGVANFYSFAGVVKEIVPNSGLRAELSLYSYEFAPHEIERAGRLALCVRSRSRGMIYVELDVAAPIKPIEVYFDTTPDDPKSPW